MHILYSGAALCGFKYGQFPGQWPMNHYWTYPYDLENVTCTECRDRVQRYDLTP